MGNLTIQEVRARMLISRPYYGVAAMSLRLVEKPGLGTMAVDKHWRLYYDPAQLAIWSNGECAAVLEHELGHLLRDHSGRQLGRAHTQWNYAGDMEINDDLSGLPAHCLHPSMIGQANGLTAEEYFDALPPPPPGGGGTCPGGHPPGGKGTDCGSGSGGERREWEIQGDGEIQTPGSEGVGQAEGDAIRKTTAEEVKAAGDAPGGLRRWADAVLAPPRIPWNRLLPQAVRAAVVQGTPSRYKYPSRRQSAPIIMPRLASCRPGAAIVVDTSGSISDKDLALALAIIKGALKHADLAIYACDTEAVRINRLAPGCMTGGGGTNMMTGVRVALQGKPKPHAIVIITDCYSPWDAEPPSVPVVILTANPDQAPSWAKVITIEGGF